MGKIGIAELMVTPKTPFRDAAEALELCTDLIFSSGGRAMVTEKEAGYGTDMFFAVAVFLSRIGAITVNNGYEEKIKFLFKVQ
jgi:hypothetical protein